MALTAPAVPAPRRRCPGCRGRPAAQRRRATGTGTPGCLSVPGLRPGQDAPALSQPLAAQLIALGSKPIRTVWQLIHRRIL
jgi:hypothetical protein